ncbi:hypothetical protein [Deinococcus hohokamensis]|uniref:Uncharacterized protein n=1 Tax=Deinococcus hohokamensis TaxID=309883 RepID=A0ABV9IBA0_9DEIO
MAEDQMQTGQQTHPEGGDKDVQDQGVLEKGCQTGQTSQQVTGELDGPEPINRRA